MKNVILIGTIAGIVGGIVFGILMQMMGMMAMVAMLAGSESLIVGWFVHIIISIVFGVAFALIATKVTNIWGLSLGYGVVIWIVGPLVFMPLMLGMGTNLGNAFAPDQLMSLGTHILFSVIVAIVYKLSTEKILTNTSASA